MNKVISLKCKNCGSNMTLVCEGKYKCEYCDSEFVIDNDSENFSIRAGILERYLGVSVEIIVPDNVTVIGKAAFKDLETIETVYIPECVTKIEDEAFMGCSALKRIVFPDGIKYIGKYAFKGCGLTELSIDSILEYIGEGAFMECINLTRVKLSESLPSNCSKIFKNCGKLSNVEISPNAFAQSFKPSMEARKQGDRRPTYFDFFHGTPYYSQMQSIYSQNICLCCNEKIEEKKKCDKCGAVYYDRDSISFWLSSLYRRLKNIFFAADTKR